VYVLRPASTIEWISSNLQESEMLSGFLGRFLFVFAEPSDKSFPFRKEFDTQLEAKIRKQLNDLITNVKNQGAIAWSPEAIDIYSKWYTEDRKQNTLQKSNVSSFISRHRDYVKKISALCQLAENGSHIVSGPNMQLAIDLVEVLRQQLFYALKTSLFVEFSQQIQQKMLDFIGNNPGCTISDIYRHRDLAGRNRAAINEAIETLKEKELIFDESIRNRRGKPTTRYYITK
jgi:hypothetical protein